MASTKTDARIAGTISRALNVLREATGTRGKTKSRGVALALWNLRSWVADDWLVSAWKAAGSDHEIGQSQGLYAAYNGIARQIRSNGGTVT